MKLALKCVFLLSLVLGSSAYTAVAEDISTPKYIDIRFSQHSIALITERAAYSFDRKVGLGHPLTGELPNNFQISTARQKLDSIRVNSKTTDSQDTLWDQWETADGHVLQTTDGYCGEGAEIYHDLRYMGKPKKMDSLSCKPAHSISLPTCLGKVEIDTNLPGCESISDFEVIGDQLWLGSYEQHEYVFGAGSGVRVISLKSKKLIAAFSPKRKSMDGYVMPLNFDAQTGKLSAVKKAAVGRANGGKIIAQSKGLLADGYVIFIRHDTVTNDVWVLTQTALHRISNEKVVERWYISEQFNTDGQVTLLASLKPKNSNPWAIMARETKLIDAKPIWKQLKESPNLAKRLTYEYDHEGNFFRIDRKPISGYDEKGELIVRTWEYERASVEAAQQIINRLKTKQ